MWRLLLVTFATLYCATAQAAPAEKSTPAPIESDLTCRQLQSALALKMLNQPNHFDEYASEAVAQWRRLDDYRVEHGNAPYLTDVTLIGEAGNELNTVCNRMLDAPLRIAASIVYVMLGDEIEALRKSEQGG